MPSKIKHWRWRPSYAALMSPLTIGFIGLGSMGGPMAVNLARAGHTVRGFDVAASALDRLKGAGGLAATSPAEAARAVDLLAVVVATAEQVDAVLFGNQPAVPALAPGRTIVVHSTVAPDYMRSLGHRLAVGGHELLDAPISGGRVRAEAGTLIVMASGSAAAFTAADPELAVVAERVYRLGEATGTASTVKMVNQHLAGVHIAAAAEAIALGTRAGANPRVLFEVISQSAGSSWMFQNRVPHMLEGDYAPWSAVDIFVKDLGIVLDAGRGLRFPLPLAAAAHQQFLASAAAGHGRHDDAAVVKVYETLAGIDVAAAARESAPVAVTGKPAGAATSGGTGSS
jgi:putative dehydrogenase